MELELIHQKNHTIRELRVMLDFDLAELYGTETKYLKRSVRANIKRFPSDFMFELSKSEWESLRCKNCTLKIGRGQHSKYLPFAFTEQGVAMLSSVLHSERAIDVNIEIMRAFVIVKELIFSNKELTQKLQEIETQFNKQFDDIYEAINYLLKKDNQEKQQKNRPEIGYKNKK